MEFNKYEKWMTLNDVIQYSNLSALIAIYHKP